MKTKIYILSAVLIILFCSFVDKKGDNTLIFDFDSEAVMGSWSTLNDDVMGGVSSSRFTLNEEGHGVFNGDVSTANNGGFASVRYRSTINTSDFKKIKVRLKGDGRDYQFRIKKNASDFESYITTFSTSGKWETIEFNLKDFYPSFRGRKLDKPNFDADSFEELSFLIANKKNESFELLLDKIELQ